jgi:hypothetical protein
MQDFVDKGWLSPQDAAMFSKTQTAIRSGQREASEGVMSPSETVKWYARQISGEDKGDAYDAVWMDLNRFVLTAQEGGKLTSGQIDEVFQGLLYEKITREGFWNDDEDAALGSILADTDEFGASEVVDAFDALRRERPQGEITKSEILERAAAMRGASGY